MRNVVDECNKIYRLYKKWNPTFNGRISIAGHSLGSAIAFDILCRQPDVIPESNSKVIKDDTGYTLEFEVDSFFGLGSPVGLFQMLKGKTIAPRMTRSESDSSSKSPLRYDIDNPFANTSKYDIKTSSQDVSRPRVEDIYNIFHPADPIGYRLEPLVVKRMASLKPQAIPATRRGLNNQIANLAELSSRVAQSASNMWSSMASGLASTILNKSLGYDQTGAGAVPTASSRQFYGLATADSNSAETGEPNETATSVETLYSRFQRESNKVSKVADAQVRIQRDSELIHGLNYTGRLDFALPEGYMDITILSSLSSHLGYFKDEDVANFVMGQLLSRPNPKRVKSEKMRSSRI